MGSREPEPGPNTASRDADRRLERLIEFERLQSAALAAHVRYVQSLLHASEGVPPEWLEDMAVRLDVQTQRLEALGVDIREAPPQPRRSARSDPDDLDLLYLLARGPLGTLAEELDLRAAALGCALDEVEAFDDGRATKVFREHLHQLEADLDLLRKRLGR